MFADTFFSSLGWLIAESSLRALLIGAVAALVLLGLRNRNVHLAHRVWVAVVVGMLALPVLSATLPGLAILPVGLLANTRELARFPLDQSMSIEELNSENKFSKPDPASDIDTAAVQRRNDAANILADKKGAQALKSNAVAAGPADSLSPMDSRDLRNSIDTFPGLLNFLEWLGLGWLVGFVLMLGYRIFGLVQLWRLLASANQIENLIDISVPARTNLFESLQIRTPVLVGLFQHRILLPSGWRNWSAEKIRAVIAHETAHIERADGLVGAIADLATMFYWFHPLAWLAAAKMKQQAEFCCDEAAALKMGDSLGYARQLVEIASLNFSAPNRQPGIAMARCSEISKRVGVLIDSSHKLRSSISFRAALLLSAVTLPAILTAATLQPAAKQDLAAKLAEADPTISQQDEELTPEFARFELEIVGPAGEPVPFAEADVRTGKSHWKAEQIEVGTFEGPHRLGANCKADEHGRLVFQYPQISSSNFLSISISHPDYAHYILRWENERPPQQQKIELDAGITVGGLIVDEDGKPITNATVKPFVAFKSRPEDRREILTGLMATSDLEGRWTLDGIPAHLESMTVQVMHRNFAHATVNLATKRFQLAKNQVPAEKLILNKGLVVAGQVVDEQGQPISRALVRAKFSNDLREATTNQEGHYELAGCLEGATKIVVSAAGKAIDMKVADIAPEMPPVNFKLDQGGRVRVRVIDQEGQPVPKAIVFMQMWRNSPSSYFEFDPAPRVADENGVWEWNEAPQDEFFADISHPTGMGLPMQRLCAGEDEFVFTVFPKLEILGKVIDSETKKPIEVFEVIPGMLHAPGSLSWSPSEKFIGKNGQFKLARTYPYLAHLVKLQAEGYLPVQSREIKSSEGRVELLFKMKRAESRGPLQVLTPDGKPAVGTQIAVGVDGSQIMFRNGEIDQRSTFAEQLEVNSTGQVQIPAQADQYQLILVHETGFAHINQDSYPQDDQIQLKKWAQAEGVFKIAGKPVAGVKIGLSSGEIYKYGLAHVSVFDEAITDAAGRYRFEKVFPGKGIVYRSMLVQVGQVITSTTTIRTEFRSNQTTTVNFGEKGVGVSGRLLPQLDFVGDVTWSNTHLYLSPNVPDKTTATLPSYMATVKGDGTFLINDVQAGKYLLSVDLYKQPIGSLQNKPIEVPADANGQPAEVFDLGEIRLNKSPQN